MRREKKRIEEIYPFDKKKRRSMCETCQLLDFGLDL